MVYIFYAHQIVIDFYFHLCIVHPIFDCDFKCSSLKYFSNELAQEHVLV